VKRNSTHGILAGPESCGGGLGMSAVYDPAVPSLRVASEDPRVRPPSYPTHANEYTSVHRSTSSWHIYSIIMPPI
jgi:hypothetical protein